MDTIIRTEDGVHFSLTSATPTKKGWMIMNSDTSLEMLSIQSGVPVYLLNTLERMGLIEASRYETANDDEQTITLNRAQHVLALRQLGFSLDQIAALLDAEDIETPNHIPHAIAV